MTVSVTDQLGALVGALLLGIALGFFYDLLRVLRVLFPLRRLGGILDLFFWLSAIAVLFVWSVTSGNGQVRLSVCLFLFFGSVGYFRLISPRLLPILRRIALRLRQLLGFITAPLGRLSALGDPLRKKFFNFSKKLFSSGKK